MAMVGRRALETGTKIEQSDRMKRGAEAMDHMRKIMYFFYIKACKHLLIDNQHKSVKLTDLRRKKSMDKNAF